MLSSKEIFAEVERLSKAGRVAEAKALFEQLRAKVASEPDTVTVGPKGAVFKRRGRIVVQDSSGDWHPANPAHKRQVAAKA